GLVGFGVVLRGLGFFFLRVLVVVAAEIDQPESAVGLVGPPGLGGGELLVRLAGGLGGGGGHFDGVLGVLLCLVQLAVRVGALGIEGVRDGPADGREHVHVVGIERQGEIRIVIFIWIVSLGAIGVDQGRVDLLFELALRVSLQEF